MFLFITFYHEKYLSKCIIKNVLWKLRKYISTCNISINNLWWLDKQPHYCVWLVRSLPPYSIGVDRYHPPNFKQPEQHMTPVNLDAALYVSTFIWSVLLLITLSAFLILSYPSCIPFIFDKPFWNELNDIVVSDCIERKREWVLHLYYLMRAFLWIRASGPDLSLYWCVFALYRWNARWLRLHTGQQLRLVNCWVHRQWLNKSYLV